MIYISYTNVIDAVYQGRQDNFWAPWQKETWPPSSNSPNNDTQTKSTTKNDLMNCDLENNFLFVYLSGLLIIAHEAPARRPGSPPLPPSVGLPSTTRIVKSIPHACI